MATTPSNLLLVAAATSAAVAAAFYYQKKQNEKQQKLDDQTDDESEGSNETDPNALVVQSWETVKAIDNYREVAGELLFKRIFEINPGASAFFTKFTNGYKTTDQKMYEQKAFKKHSTAVVSSVTAAVGLLEKGDLTTLVAVLKDLGAKHAAAGLKLEKAHYELVGQALLDTLGAALGDAFTPDVKQAWAGVYGIITEKMMEGAAEASN